MCCVLLQVERLEAARQALLQHIIKPAGALPQLLVNLPWRFHVNAGQPLQLPRFCFPSNTT
jgi:hypothetical protein